VSKFVGKFKKQKDYNDDYDYAGNILQNKKRKGESGEIKKIMKMYREEEFMYESGENKKNRKH
jgi:hypothetical protein